MPKGSAAAKKVGSYKSNTFEERPPGIRYFSLPGDGDTCIVRFLQNYEDIEWASKWVIGQWPNSENVNKIDQLQDGTPDPGYAANLKSTFKAYPTMIWRQAPVYQKGADDKYIKDGNDRKIVIGYADTVAVWECSYSVYEILEDKDDTYRGLMNLDWRIKRKGSGKKTVYTIEPADPTQINVPMSQQDQQLAIGPQKIDPSVFTKIPTYEALATYLNGGVNPNPPQQSFTQQVDNNASGPEGPNPFLIN